MSKPIKDKKQREAVFAAELRATDREDTQKCQSDMQKFAELDEESARIVTSAIRSKQIPTIARQSGLDEKFIQQLVPLDKGKATGFANEKDEEPEEELPIGETEEEEIEDSEPEMETEDTNDEEVIDEEPEEESFIPKEDTSEVEDNDELTATINVEVPAEMVDEIKEAIEGFLAEKYGGEEPQTIEEKFEAPIETEEIAPQEAELPEEGELEPENIIENNRSEEMDKEALAQRKAYRQSLLTRVAASEDIKPKDIGLGKDTSFNGKPFQYSDKLQHEGETEYPKMTMTGSEGNSLKGDPGYASIPIPTKNPENLQLKDSYTQFNFSGGDDGTLDFSADFEAMTDIPSGGETASDEEFAIPTQQEQKKRTTTVAKIVTCQGCDNPGNDEVSTVDCKDCGQRLCLCSACLDEDYCPSCATRIACEAPGCPAGNEEKVIKVSKEVQSQTPNVPNVTIQPDDPTMQGVKNTLNDIEQVPPAEMTTEFKNASVFQARLKTAYDVATQLALAKIIEPEEVSQQVDLWVNDGLSAKSMKTQGALMLRSASTANERIAAAAAKSQNIRTASVNSAVSTNPSFISTTPSHSVSELQDTLRGMFMERFAD